MTVTEAARPSTRRRPKPGRSLAELNPELALQWDAAAHGDLTPLRTSCGTQRIQIVLPAYV